MKLCYQSFVDDSIAATYLRRLDKHLNSGKNGEVSFMNVVAGYAQTMVPTQPGETAFFQVWFRDKPAHRTPCGKKANFTNAYSVTFTP